MLDGVDFAVADLERCTPSSSPLRQADLCDESEGARDNFEAFAVRICDFDRCSKKFGRDDLSVRGKPGCVWSASGFRGWLEDLDVGGGKRKIGRLDIDCAFNVGDDGGEVMVPVDTTLDLCAGCWSIDIGREDCLGGAL